MSTIIKLLERIGQDANLQDSEMLKQAIEQAKLDKGIVTALASKNSHNIVNELDLCPDVKCLMLPAKDDEAEEDKPSEPNEQEKTNIKLSA